MSGPPGSVSSSHKDRHPREVWPFARAAARKVIAPVERFLAIEAASGILLLFAAAAALVWANSPWRASYVGLWHTPIAFKAGPISFERDVHFWINDGLMTIFFFVIGLEIRREIYKGELSELKRAALPLVAAVGGMLMPAAIYVALNGGRPTNVGWGVPMATDIAFAVGVLALLGSRVSPALRVLLLALAVIDDVGAILVIAVFYSGSLNPIGLAVAGAGIAGLLLLQKAGVRTAWPFIFPGAVIWAGAYVTGIHPTLAGVVVGLLTPVRAWFGPGHFVEHAEETLVGVKHHHGNGNDREILHLLDGLDAARREAVSPVERLQHALHGWVAFGIMPIFAVANAGVPLGSAELTGPSLSVLAGVVAGLVLGKPAGILVLSWLATKAGIAALPRGVRWRDVFVVGLVAGIGFTMAIFVAGLAFPPGAWLETAKLGILVASAVAAVLGLIVGRLVLRRAVGPGIPQTAAEAESSTDA